jgi:hypothetical protein
MARYGIAVGRRLGVTVPDRVKVAEGIGEILSQHNREASADEENQGGGSADFTLLF